MIDWFRRIIERFKPGTSVPKISPILVIGLTGGIASGKTAVSDLLAAAGATIVDTDQIAREIVEPGEPALDEIAVRFGTEVIAEDGTLDRRALRKTVFSDSRARADLEAITHPRIRAIALQRVVEATGRYVVLVVPLLIESQLREAVQRVLVVDCDPETQLRRLLDRDGGDRDTAEAIIASQTDRETRLAAADDVIRNDGDFRALQDAVDKLHQRYLAIADSLEHVAE